MSCVQCLYVCLFVVNRFGHAGDMYSSSSQCSPRGIFRIDLKGTPFVLSSHTQWQWRGQYARGPVTKGTLDVKITSKYLLPVTKGTLDVKITSKYLLSVNKGTLDVKITSKYLLSVTKGTLDVKITSKYLLS